MILDKRGNLDGREFHYELPNQFILLSCQTDETSYYTIMAALPHCFRSWSLNDSTKGEHAKYNFRQVLDRTY